MSLSNNIPEKTGVDPLLRKYLLLGIGLSIIEFILLKICYPYPDFFSDSYSYISVAYEHLDIGIWPIGYSKFLNGVHSISHSAVLLVAIQFILVQAASYTLFVTIYRLFNPSKLTINIIFYFITINPFTLYLCNTINSDAIFAAFSIFWINSLLLIIKRPTIKQYIIHAILIFICFTIRNNAYYYPFISAVAILITKDIWYKKLVAVAMPTLLIISFIFYTKEKARELTGYSQYSLFTGWQLANNALYVYDKLQIDSTIFQTKESQIINQIAKGFASKNRGDDFHELLDNYTGNFFIREPKAPLKVYFSHNYHSKTEIDVISDWGNASKHFEEFGKPTILHYPLTFARYFVLPNIKHYFISPLSHIGLYNYGQNKIDHIASEWFDFETNKVRSISPSFQGKIITIYQLLFGFMNLFFLLNLVQYLSKYKLDLKSSEINSYLLILTLLVSLNFLFSITTTENILRYQYVPLFILIIFVTATNNFLKETKREISNKKSLTNTPFITEVSSK